MGGLNQLHMVFRVTNMIPGDVVFYKHNRDYKGIVLKVSDTLVEVLWLGFDESEWMPHYSLDVV